MASFEITFKPSVRKDLAPIPRDMVARILKKIGTLAENPFPPQSVKLSGSEGVHRIRVGDYRAVYQVDIVSRTITINYVRHRKDAYR